MSFNLIDLVKDQLSDQVMGSLGNVIGSDSSQNDLAISSALPGLLSGLTDLGGTSSGADSLFKGIDAQDDGILDNLGDLLGGSEQSNLMKGGIQVLSSLLGGGGLGSLVSSISGFSGTSKTGTSSLLSLLAPIVFGVIKRKLIDSGGFNVSGLMGMLNDQKSNVSASMPTGFKLISDASDALGSMESSIENTVERAQDTFQDSTVVENTKSGGSFLGKLLPLAILIGVALLAYNYFIKNNSGSPAEPSIAEIQGSLVDFEKNVSSSISSVTNSFNGITSVESAKAAVPGITESASKLGNLASMFDKLPDATKGPVTKLVSEGTTNLQVIIDKLGAIPGVAEIIAPIVKSLSETLKMFQ